LKSVAAQPSHSVGRKNNGENAKKSMRYLFLGA